MLHSCMSLVYQNTLLPEVYGTLDHAGSLGSTAAPEREIFPDKREAAMTGLIHTGAIHSGIVSLK